MGFPFTNGIPCSSKLIVLTVTFLFLNLPIRIVSPTLISSLTIHYNTIVKKPPLLVRVCFGLFFQVKLKTFQTKMIYLIVKTPNFLSITCIGPYDVITHIYTTVVHFVLLIFKPEFFD